MVPAPARDGGCIATGLVPRLRSPGWTLDARKELDVRGAGGGQIQVPRVPRAKESKRPGPRRGWDTYPGSHFWSDPAQTSGS